MAVLVTYNLTGAGGAECFVELGDQTAHVTASYLSDALGDLLRAVVTVLSGGLESTASFAEEPGEYRWRFLRTSDDVLAVRILWFKESRTDWPDERGEVVMDSQCRLRTFAGAVLSASQRVLQEHGVDGYRQKWGRHEFPLELQSRLKAVLDETREKTFAVATVRRSGRRQAPDG